MSPEVQSGSRPRPQNPNRVDCDFCGRHFSRPSHLNRHRLSHLPPERRLTIPCDKCRKTFGRYDVLLRHLRSTHNIDLGRRHPAQRSCDRCVQKRRRCDRRLPCELCQATGDVCHYPDHVTGTYPDKTAPLGAVAQAEAEAVAAAASRRGSAGHTGHSDNADVNGNANSSNNTSDRDSRGSSTTMDPSTHSSSDIKGSPATAATDISQEQLFNAGFPSATLGTILSNPLVDALPNDCNASGLPAMPYSNSFVPSFPDTSSNTIPSAPFIPPSLPTSENEDYSGPRLDWLDFQMQNFSQPSSYPIIPSNVNVPVDTPLSMEPMPSVETAPSTDTPPPVSTLRTREIKCPVALPKISALNMPISHELSWLTKKEENQHPQRFMLPPLREVMQNTLRIQIPGFDATAKDMQYGLVSLMGEAYMSKPETITEPSIADARRFLTYLIDMYFENTHPLLPIVHRPTFDSSELPTVLIAAMACFGALTSDSKNGAADAKIMSEITMSIITYLNTSNGAVFGDITYISALCLHLQYSVWSGNQQLYHYADRLRGLLVGGLRGVKTLSVRLSTDTDEECGPAAGSASNVKELLGMNVESIQENTRSHTTAPSAKSLKEEWEEWVRIERVKRVAWATFEFDCSLCALTNHPSVMGLNELPTNFPCTESLWEAESAEAWAALRNSLTTEDFSGVPLSMLLATLMEKPVRSSEPITELLSFWGRRICGELLAQLMWNTQELDLMGSSDFLGLPSLITMKEDNDTRLLRGFDKLMESAKEPITKAGKMDYNMSGILWHFSYLFTNSSLVDDILYIIRNPDKGAIEAQRRVTRSLGNNPRKTRSLVWHAAQITAIAKDYLTEGSCEVMRVFISYCYLIIIAKLCPHRNRPQSLVPKALASTETTVRIDTPMHHKNERTGELVPAINCWIETGQPPSIVGSCTNIHDPNLAKILCNDTRDWLRQLKYVGMKETFTNLIDNYQKLQFM